MVLTRSCSTLSKVGWFAVLIFASKVVSCYKCKIVAKHGLKTRNNGILENAQFNLRKKVCEIIKNGIVNWYDLDLAIFTS